MGDPPTWVDIAITGTGRICAIAFDGAASGTTPLHFTYGRGSKRGGLGMCPTMLDAVIAARSAERMACICQWSCAAMAWPRKTFFLRLARGQYSSGWPKESEKDEQAIGCASPGRA
jgi:hypothetical protein